MYGSWFHNNMANFRERRRVETRTPQVKVDGGLPVGRHTFRLTVVDSSGNRSRSARIVVNIIRIRDRPVPVDPPPVGPTG
jgi:hypothetical protein